MKKLFTFLLLLFALTTNAQLLFENGTTVYLVRHAEKDTGNNPALTAAGNQRAQLLFDLIDDDGIDVVYSTKTKRTEQTADPFVKIRRLNLYNYKNDSAFLSLIQQIKTNGHSKKNILIVGHSNTIPDLVRAFGVDTFSLKQLGDFEYDKIFKIEFKRKRIKFTTYQYGEESPLHWQKPAMKN